VTKSAAATAPALWRARLAAQWLSRPVSAAPEDVARRLLAVQAQDSRGFRLAVRSRTTGLHAADVDAALTERRSLVVSWLNRGTLQLVTASDYWWLHALTTPQLATGNRRRLGQEGVSPTQAERGIDVVREAVSGGQRRTRGQLKDLLDEAGVPTEGQALIHVLLAATLEGLVIRGPVVGAEQAFVAPEDWLGPAPAALDREEAMAKLAHRYLEGHGPATAADLAKWAGIPLRGARQGLEAVADETTVTPDGLVDLETREPALRAPAVRMLGAFDPLLLGWADRDGVLGAHRHVVTTNGVFRPVVLVDGRVFATWGLPGGTVTVYTLDDLPRSARPALDAEASDVLRFLALPDSPIVELRRSAGRTPRHAGLSPAP
jgi:hypothetical protein